MRPRCAPNASDRSVRFDATLTVRLAILVRDSCPMREWWVRRRLAVAADAHTAMNWFTRFQVEAGAHLSDVEPIVRDRIENQLLWLWEDDAGHPVSMAGRNRTAAGAARIGPVYTPPEHRRRGYGAAITGACTGDALSRDAHDVVLFTDLANPTSNAIYQQIGYRPLRDHLIIEFEEH